MNISYTLQERNYSVICLITSNIIIKSYVKFILASPETGLERQKNYFKYFMLQVVAGIMYDLQLTIVKVTYFLNFRGNN